jgi:hypothetical protein
MLSLHEQAEFHRICLGMGLLGVDDAVTWADRSLMAMENPPIEIINVALSGDQPVDEVMRLLASVTGPADLEEVAHEVLGLLSKRLIAGEITLESTVDMLWVYHIRASVSEDEIDEACNFSYCLEFVQEGAYGTVESVLQDVKAFLDRHATPSEYS